MTKYKTSNEDIIDILKHGNLGYMDLVEYVENTYDLHGLFLDCDFGYKDSDCMNFDGTINLFPFYNYKLQFTLEEQDNKPTRVVFARYCNVFRGMNNYCPTISTYKTNTKITSREQFVARLVAWHNFVDNSKLIILKNSENYIKDLDQLTIDKINNYLEKYRFNYTVSFDSMNQSYEIFKNTIDANVDMIKKFVNPGSEYEIE